MPIETRLPSQISRIRCILTREFNADAELRALRESGHAHVADAVEDLIGALCAHPPKWSEAAAFASVVADDGYGSCPGLNDLRDELLHALIPLLFDLPTTESEMAEALALPESSGAQALAAARILRCFPLRF